MTVVYGGVELKNAGKAQYSFPTLTNSTTLMSGKNYTQESTQYKTRITVTGFCQWADVEAFLALVGSKLTLVTEHDTWTNMVIEGEPDFTESDDPGWFNYTVLFTKHSA